MSWLQTDRIVPPPGVSSGDFGGAISIDGDTLAIGAPADDEVDTWSGAVYVYKKIGGAWVFQQKLLASTPHKWARFGNSVSVSGDTIAVGHGNAGAGMAYNAVHVFVETAGIWGEQQRLTASDIVTWPFGHFGWAVALKNDTLAVGVPYAGANDEGSVHIYTRTAGVWTEAQKLWGSVTAAWGYFGEDVCISNDWLAIAAPFDHVGGVADVGAVYAFQQVAGNWVEMQRLYASDYVLDDRLCFRADGLRALALQDGVLVAGCHRKATLIGGAAYVFTLSGGVWSQLQKLEQTVPAGIGGANERFGIAVATNGQRVYVGASEAELAAWIPDISGVVYVYTFSGGVLIEETILEPTRISSLAPAGTFILCDSSGMACTSTELFVGAADDDDGFVYSTGAVYCFLASAAMLDFSHSFEVTRIDSVSSNLRPRQILNQFDEHGLVAGVRRNVGEKNWSYRRRIYDAWVNIANSSYRGLINGITRELGLELFEAVSISPKKRVNSELFYAPDPYIKVEGPTIYLYSNYIDGVLDYELDRWTAGGNLEKLGWLIDFINSTTYFEGYLHSGVSRQESSMILLNQTNRECVYNEFIPASNKFRLKNKRIVEGTIFFSNRVDFRREVLTEGDVGRAGDFFINYNEGIVVCYSPSVVNNTVRYQYIVDPFTLLASPIIINDINNEEFKTKLFGQILLDDGTNANCLPNELGTDIINELLTVVPLYFGV